MSDIFARQRHTDNCTRAAQLKARLGVGDVMHALSLNSDAGDLCPFPQCGAIGAVKLSASGETFACEACGETGDIITMVRAFKSVGFAQALDLLEDIAPRRQRSARQGSFL